MSRYSHFAGLAIPFSLLDKNEFNYKSSKMCGKIWAGAKENSANVLAHIHMLS